MRRRRWARAAALCLAIAVVLQLAVNGAGAAAGTPLSGRPRGHAARRWLPASPPLVAAHHAIPKPKTSPGGSGRTVAFDATAAAGSRCKTSTARKSVTAGGDAACADDDDDKRVAPTGPNPLHNR